MIVQTSYILYALFGIVLILIIWNVRMEMRLKRIFKGKKASDLEGVMSTINNDIDALKDAALKANSNISVLDKRLRKSIRGVETIRFNPFKDQGSNQSFAIAFLSEEGDGVVISSLYSRERVSVFAKPIKGNKSEYELTEEESAALGKALPK